MSKYYARCASDKDPEWPVWIVCNQSGINVIARLQEKRDGTYPGATFLSKDSAIELADWANNTQADI